MYGCTSKSQSSYFAINIGDLPQYEKKAGSTTIDLGRYKITKLLGSGSVSKAYTVTVQTATQKAIEKIQGAKGTVTTTDASAATESTTKNESA
jgi:ribosomal protein L15